MRFQDIAAVIEAPVDESNGGLGTVNGYVSSPARFNGQAFTFNGTTKGLVLAAVEQGARAGDTVVAAFGDTFWHEYTITPNGGGPRTPGGVWAQRN